MAIWKRTWCQSDTRSYKEKIKENAEIRRCKVAYFQRFFYDHKRHPHRHMKIKQQMAEDLRVEFMQYRRNPNHNRTKHIWTLHNMLKRILDLGCLVSFDERIFMPLILQCSYVLRTILAMKWCLLNDKLFWNMSYNTRSLYISCLLILLWNTSYNMLLLNRDIFGCDERS